ncbi:MAG: hypothetical protein HOP27_04875 [Anaerolineales bacterium]|nr:hypothetical protein [Anaerolineales bacterium]
MKTLGRILIILVVFAALSGLMVVGVNALGLSVSNFRGEGGEFRPGGDGEGFPPPSFRPDGDDGGFRPEGFEERGERGERRGGVAGMMFGAIKNIFVIALLVTVIVWPKSIARSKRKNGAVKSAVTE